jgi:hypothetical protein
MACQPYGALGQRYAELGGPASWLGACVVDELPFAEGGRVALFEHGSIYWWPDTGAIELANVALRYKGMYCFSTTDGWFSDEPYVTIGVAPTPPGAASSMRSPIYDDTDGGDSRPDNIELYRGRPFGAQLMCALWEHDAGDQDAVVGTLRNIADVVARRGAEACGDNLGPDVADICGRTWDEHLGDVVGGLLNDLFGVGDDRISTWTWRISAKDMVRSIRAPLINWWGIEYHIESLLQSGDGADYKVYLDVVPV